MRNSLYQIRLYYPFYCHCELREAIAEIRRLLRGVRNYGLLLIKGMNNPDLVLLPQYPSFFKTDLGETICLFIPNFPGFIPKANPIISVI